MSLIHNYLFLALWLSYVAYWWAMSANLKPTELSEPVLVQSEMEKNIFPLVKIQHLRGGDFLGMRIHRPMPVSRSFALAR